jgi:hypothetical protein
MSLSVYPAIIKSCCNTHEFCVTIGVSALLLFPVMLRMFGMAIFGKQALMPAALELSRDYRFRFVALFDF